MAKHRAPVVAIPEATERRLMEAFAGLYEPGAASAYFTLRATASRLNHVAATWLAEYGLNPKALNLLIMLYTATDDAASIGDLRRATYLPASSVTVMLDALAHDGWLRRTIDRGDRRTSVVRLTASGRRRLEMAFKEHLNRTNAVFGALAPGERRELRSLLLKVNAGLDATDQSDTLDEAGR